MDFELKDLGNSCELFLQGRLTFDGNAAFRTIIETLEKKSGRSAIVDLSGLDFIDSAGLGMLLLLQETCGRGLSLRAPKGQVRRLLAAAHFQTIVPIAG
ncbi:STAS domain-containing protein [Telmatospirillum sp.]|uniref:STAS domain-containing protein n=1 Tax=Telmatospirillum sp. TaxID=2079197 RepID=UPI00283AD981|nr:STAS domain-containing protein [Telmatospirillum sp.]MDR3439813.1 STAS domain-containing protein [Telmatospirillum sp.]